MYCVRHHQPPSGAHVAATTISGRETSSPLLSSSLESTKSLLSGILPEDDKLFTIDDQEIISCSCGTFAIFAKNQSTSLNYLKLLPKNSNFIIQNLIQTTYYMIYAQNF